MDANWSVARAPEVIDGPFSLDTVRRVGLEDGDLILDLSQTSMLTRDGCDALVELHDELERAGYELALQDPPLRIAEVLRATNTDQVLAVMPPSGALPDD
jgi:anti-anti-sigma regulatory factor